MAGKIFYGWIVVAAVFVITFVSFGIAFCFSAFIEALQLQFNATRGEVSLIFALSGFLYFALGPVSGSLADRIGPRWVVVFGMLTIAAGLLLTSRAQSLWQVYLAYGLGIGIGVGFCYVPAIGTVQRWFTLRRGVATGLAVAGIGSGTLVMPPVAAALIAQGGWRGSYLMLALLPVVIGVAAALLLVHSPQLHGRLPDGEPLAPRSPERDQIRQEIGPTTRGALRSRPFWLLYGGSFLVSLGEYLPFVHLAPYARDHGLSEHTGLFLVSLFGTGSLAGRFAMGGIADRFGRSRSLAATFAGMAVMLLWWADSTSFWALAVFALVFGAGYGGHIAILPAISADYFGGRNGSGIFGLLATNFGFGSLLGPALAGLTFDLTASYLLPTMASAVAAVAAAFCLMLIEDPARWRRRHMSVVAELCRVPET
jgi:MFS family permease